MGDKHLQNFFGNKTSMFVRSTSKVDPFILLQFITKYKNGSWEKPSNGQGLLLKFNLDEIIMIREVLKGEFKSWSTNLTVKGKDFNISLNWNDNSNLKLWINVERYSKMLDYSQVQLFISLLDHLLKEKVKYSTITSSTERNDLQVTQIRKIETSQEKPYKKSIPSKKNQTKETKYIGNTKVTVKKSFKKPVKEITGTIKFQTKKAIFLELSSGEEKWVPKSVIQSLFKSWGKMEQTFYVDSWFFKANLIPIQS